MMWWNHDGNWGAGQWLSMGFMMVIFWALVISLGIWVIRSVRSGRDSDAHASIPAQSADEVLAQWFARGEIEEQEFTKRRAALHQPATVPSRQRRR